MKQLFILTVSFIVASINFSYSQSVIFRKDSVGGKGDSANEIIVGNWIKNNTSNPINVRWVKTPVSLPSGWDVYICDLNLCYDASVDSQVFTMPANDSGIMQAHFNPNNHSGFGKVKLLIYDTLGSRNSGKTAIFTGLTVKAGIDEPFSTNTYSIYPVPAHDNLFIDFNKTGIYNIEILDLSGKRLMAQKFINTSLADITVSGIPAGFYFAKITTVSGWQTILTFSKN